MNNNKNLTTTLSAIPPIAQMRKNHALEHTTINLLESAAPEKGFSGWSIHNGFWILGHCDIQTIQETVDLALAKLRNGQKQLAIHPSCGTNLMMSGLLTAIGALVTLRGTKKESERISRLSSLVLVSGAMLQLSKPLGPWVQANITVDPDMTGISVIGIDTGEIGSVPCYFVRTELKA